MNTIILKNKQKCERGDNCIARINSNWYTKGKFDRKNWRNTLDDAIRNYDFIICGSDNIDVLFAIEENSNIDTTEIRNKIKEKFDW